MALDKFRAFMDLGRVQGFSVTAAVAMLGAMTAVSAPSPLDMLWLAVISFFAHVGGAAMNELWDRKLDSAIPELARKPMVSGAISPREAKAFIAFAVPASLALAYLVFGMAAFIAALMATMWMHWYCTSGKRTFIISDFAQCVGFGAYALFGALATGEPTVLTWTFLGVVAALNLFAQWGNGLKDADNDRRFGIPSLAVRTGVTAEKGLHAGHPYFIYGVGVKAAFLLFCTIPIFLWRVPMAYVLVVVAIGYPVQYFTMREFVGIKSRQQHVKLLLGDLLSSYPAAAAVAIIGFGLTAFFLLALFVFGGYLIGSALQSGAEFKFRRQAPAIHHAPPPEPRPNVRPAPAPIMMAWARTGPSRFRRVRPELYCTRPSDPRPSRRRNSTSRRQEEVYVVHPAD